MQSYERNYHITWMAIWILFALLFASVAVVNELWIKMGMLLTIFSGVSSFIFLCLAITAGISNATIDKE